MQSYLEPTMLDPLQLLMIREPRSTDLARTECGLTLIRQVFVAQKDGTPVYTAEVTLWGAGGMEVISAEALSSGEAITRCTKRLAKFLAKQDKEEENGGQRS